MHVLLRKAHDAAELAWTYLATAHTSREAASLFTEVETYCMFIGYSRSGHSIIGSLLDAHPHAVIAHELAALKYLYVGFDRLRLYHLLLQNAQERAAAHRRAGKYIYEVSGQWQGGFKQLRVIGDKHGESATWRLRAHPWLLQRLRDTVGVPVRLVHVVRNPFDNITTMATRAAELSRLRAMGFSPSLKDCIERYFTLCETIMHVKEEVGADEFIEIRHESFVENPKTHLRTLCQALDLHPAEDYLDACAGIVYDRPNKSRHKKEWPPSLRREVGRKMAAFPFLSGYTFNT